VSSQAIYFIAGVVLILSGFIYFIRFVSRRLSDRISQHAFDRVERIIIGGIVLGVVAMFQPWLFVGYKYGFLLLLFSTLAFIVWSHITPQAVLYGEEEFVGVSVSERE
jgi:H+/Cl- antiporter ClcA